MIAAVVVRSKQEARNEPKTPASPTQRSNQLSYKATTRKGHLSGSGITATLRCTMIMALCIKSELSLRVLHCYLEYLQYRGNMLDYVEF